MGIVARLSANIHCPKCEHAMVHGGVLLLCCNSACEYIGLMFTWPDVEIDDIQLELAMDAILEVERSTGKKDERVEAIEANDNSL